MPKRIILSQDNVGSRPPEGYKSLTLNSGGEIALKGSSPTEQAFSYEKSVDSTTLICDSQNFSFGTYSIYVYEYWNKFDIGTNAFHICRMAILEEGNVFPSENFDIRNFPLIWGIFKEDGNKLVFTNAHAPILDLDIKLSDLILNYKGVDGFDSVVYGTGYSNGTYSTIGGSGTGLVVELTLSYDVSDIDFISVDPSNTFPIEAYANQTVTFDQASTTGSGSGAQIEVTFDVDGNIDTYSIISTGTGYVVDEVVTTNDPYAGILYYRVSVVTEVGTDLTIIQPGKDYSVGDVITIDGGNNDFTFNVGTLLYENVKIGDIAVSAKKIEDGIEFIYNSLRTVEPYLNTFVRFKMLIDTDGYITGSELIDNRYVDSVDFDFFSNLNSGWDESYEGDFDSQFLDYSFMTGTNFIYLRSKEVDGVYRHSFCKYNIITNVITELIEDVQVWWETYADIPWEIDGQTPGLKASVLVHPDAPMLLTYHSTGGPDEFISSYAIVPSTGIGKDNKFFKFSDNKTTDYRSWMFTKNKVYLINPLLVI